VGGTPVQNVGAYGQEVAETITIVRVLDTAANEIGEMSNRECGFYYRTSIFNSSQKGRYIVTQVSYALSPGGAPRVEYSDLKRYFESANAAPNLPRVRAAVRSIRASKAMLITPHDEDSRSAGSFFKNPILTMAEYDRIASLPLCREQKPPKYPAEEGYVKIVGRLKDMIIRGGENIYPREIEEFLYTHADVSDAQVIGIPSEKYGEEVMAWVKLKPGASLTGDDLAAFCKGKIASYKVPRHWKFVDEFPMTVTGKVRKVEMRDVSVKELGLEAAAAISTA